MCQFVARMFTRVFGTRLSSMLPVANFTAHLNDTLDACITLLVSYHIMLLTEAVLRSGRWGN